MKQNIVDDQSDCKTKHRCYRYSCDSTTKSHRQQYFSFISSRYIKILCTIHCKPCTRAILDAMKVSQSARYCWLKTSSNSRVRTQMGPYAIFGGLWPFSTHNFPNAANRWICRITTKFLKVSGAGQAFQEAKLR